MSVNVGQRNVKDTSANRQLQACEKAMNLCLHTITICNNKNIFKEEYYDSLTRDIVECSRNIYTYAWNANNVYVTKANGKYAEREKLQRAAISECNRMLALVNIARRAFHLRFKKFHYWSQIIIETRRVLTGWRESNAKQYKTE